jgi:hypothetical protein
MARAGDPSSTSLARARSGQSGLDRFDPASIRRRLEDAADAVGHVLDGFGRADQRIVAVIAGRRVTGSEDWVAIPWARPVVPR